MKYKVKLTFIYSDTLTVEADSEEEAIKIAENQCDEQYESAYDSNVEEIEE